MDDSVGHPPLSLYKSKWLSQRTTILRVGALVGMVIAGGFVSVNLFNGYLDPVPAQLSLLAALTVCSLFSYFVPRSVISGHVFLATIVFGCLLLSLTTGDAARVVPWWCVAAAFTVAIFDEWLTALLWSVTILAVAITAISYGSTIPYPNYYANTSAALIVIAMFCVFEIRSRKTLSSELTDRIGEIERSNAQLQGISALESAYIAGEDKDVIFARMLELILTLTESEYGFVGEVIRQNGEAPYMKSMAITDISWNEETSRLYDENVASGLEFRNLDTLFGEVMKSEEPVVTNSPARHPKSHGLPSGHPPLDAFMGLPIFVGPEMIGMIGVANRTGGYDDNWISFLRPLLNVCGTTILGAKEMEARKLAEKALAQAQRMEAMGQLTGGVAHDFNNILSVLMGNTELLEVEISETADTRKTIANLKLTIDRATSLTQRLLAFSRQQPLQPEATDLADMLGHYEELFGRTLGRAIDLTFSASRNLWWTMIDSRELEHALLNLALNARDAMPQGGNLLFRAANVTIDESNARQNVDLKVGDYVEILVRDTGKGMAAGVKEQIFEPFFTTKEEGTGSGLGMSMVYGFVKQSGGQVTVDSEIGRGTSVRIYLPRTRDMPQDAGVTVNSASRSVENTRILVVEDDEAVRAISTRIIQGQGYDVCEVGNGKDAVELLCSEQLFDILFTDVMLPGGMTGAEVAENAVKHQPNIKVLFTSGYSKDVLISKGQLNQGVTLISKPYRSAALVAELEALLAE